MIDLEEMRRRFDNSPYALYLGLAAQELSPGYAKIRLNLKQDFLNWENLVHGGVISSLLDQAFGCSLNTLPNIYVAVELSINFLATAPVGTTLYGESRVIQAGRRLGVAEITVTDTEGKKIARAAGTAVSLGPRK